MGAPTWTTRLTVGDVTVLVGRLRYRGRGSGVESETPAGWMLKFRDGKLIRFRAFQEPEEALEAVGLREARSPLVRPDRPRARAPRGSQGPVGRPAA